MPGLTLTAALSSARRGLLAGRSSLRPSGRIGHAFGLCAVRPRRSALPAPRPGGLACTALYASSSDDEMDQAARKHHPVLDLINDSTKWGVSAAAFGTLLLRRDVAACWCIVGSVVAAVNCRVLKYAINQSRPEAARKKDPGMPSSHANSLAFLSTFVSVASTAAVGVQSYLGLALVFGVPALAIFLVVVGWLVGSASAAWWWRLGQSWLLPALQQHPQRVWWLYGVTIAAAALFSVQNVARWFREKQHAH